MAGPAVTRNLPVYEDLKLSRYQGATIVTALGASFMYNNMMKMPRSSGLLRHALALGLGFWAGQKIEHFVEQRRKVRVLILEDYIQRHPEDFPVTEPKKYADVLMPWVPRR